MNTEAHWQQISELAAREAGRQLLSFLGKVKAREKQPRDLVTEADIEAQKTIKTILLREFPDHGFVGEEGNCSNTTSELCWIVDPLDGTTNFVHQLPGFAVSIALKQNDEILVGTVYDPVADECFSAIKGRGATLNGTPISVSTCRELSQSLLVCSFPSKVSRDGAEVNRFLNVLPEATIRRMGSAAINLSYVACGRLDGYWATSLKLWDMAAGYLIAVEAGATFSNIDGSKIDFDNPVFVMASTQELHAQLLNKM
ncbi:inositol monophosphatase [bacterium]|nr:inositol monophosphatase [bacterium]